MIYNLKNPYDLKKFKDWVQHMIDRSAVVDCKMKQPQRSMAQNAYLHLLLGYYASEFGYSVEEVKQDIFKRQVNKAIFEEERVNRRGQTVTYLRSTKDLDTAEMTLAIDRFRNWSSSECGFYLPSPNEQEALLFAMRQAELWAEFA
jgi:hypothetical protein